MAIKKLKFGLGSQVFVATVNSIKTGEVVHVMREKRKTIIEVKPKKGKNFVVSNGLFSVAEGEALEMRAKLLQEAYLQAFAAGKSSLRLAQLKLGADNDLRRWKGMISNKFLALNDLKKLDYFKAWTALRVNVAASVCNNSKHPDAVFMRYTLMNYPKLSRDVQRLIDVEKILLLLGVFEQSVDESALSLAKIAA